MTKLKKEVIISLRKENKAKTDHWNWKIWFWWLSYFQALEQNKDVLTYICAYLRNFFMYLKSVESTYAKYLKYLNVYLSVHQQRWDAVHGDKLWIWLQLDDKSYKILLSIIEKTYL